jgi:hypothetical protein
MIESFSDLQKCRYGSVLVRILLLPLKFFQPGIHLCNLLFDIPLEPFSFGHALLIFLLLTPAWDESLDPWRS